MKKEKYNIIIIGSGPAGEKAAIKSAELGCKVLVVDKNPAPGGSSLLTGTIPSKAIRATANLINQIKKKDLQGFEIKIPEKLSANEVYYRYNRVSKQISMSILEDFYKLGIKFITGIASFVDKNTIKIKINSSKYEYYSADKIIIASGSKPYHPLDIDFDNHNIHDSDSIIKIKNLPKSMIVYGAGVIGCEYASMFNCLGINITLINPNFELMMFLDKQISKQLCLSFKEKGIRLISGQKYNNIKSTENFVEVELESGEKLSSSYLLYCNGRQGVSKNLNLKNCSLATNNREQLNVNQYFQTSVKNIYAIGDIIGFPSLASIANEQGRIAAQHAIVGDKLKIDIEHMPIGIYTIPEISMIGFTEEALIEKKIKYSIGICNYDQLARARLKGTTTGILKLLFGTKNKELLGIHIFGEQATELIHLGQAVMKYKGTIDFFLENALNFPTFTSAYKVATQDGINNINS